MTSRWVAIKDAVRWNNVGLTLGFPLAHFTSFVELNRHPRIHGRVWLGPGRSTLVEDALIFKVFHANVID